MPLGSQKNWTEVKAAFACVSADAGPLALLSVTEKTQVRVDVDLLCGGGKLKSFIF